MKGVDSHGNCKTHYKDPVIASAYKSDNRTTGGHVHYMAVRNCISYPVRDYLYHSYIRVWIRAGNKAMTIMYERNKLSIIAIK